jgi:hypothetical protein
MGPHCNVSSDRKKTLLDVCFHSALAHRQGPPQRWAQGSPATHLARQSSLAPFLVAWQGAEGHQGTQGSRPQQGPSNRQNRINQARGHPGARQDGQGPDQGHQRVHCSPGHSLDASQRECEQLVGGAGKGRNKNIPHRTEDTVLGPGHAPHHSEGFFFRKTSLLHLHQLFSSQVKQSSAHIRLARPSQTVQTIACVRSTL